MSSSTKSKIGIEAAISLAIEGGYNVGPIEVDIACDHKHAHYFIDPFFWQCLGKSLGWADRLFMGEPINKKMSLWLSKREKETGEPYIEDCTTPGWKYHWHCFIDALASGQDIDSFFTSLIEKKL